ncbi:MAG: hypothetical protein IH623_24830 [Verrucomicrobia bacterium]|nr:hypothetical protein [Verrucomicrobiota bacterium]
MFVETARHFRLSVSNPFDGSNIESQASLISLYIAYPFASIYYAQRCLLHRWDVARKALNKLIRWIATFDCYIVSYRIVQQCGSVMLKLVTEDRFANIAFYFCAFIVPR